jgi:hypothetical protein
MEYCVHHHLESSRRVGEAEEHNCWFEGSLRSEEGSFPLISVFDANVVVSLADIELSEQGASTEVVNSLGNKGGDVPIFLGPFVDWPIILYWSQFSIFLLNKEEVGCIWTPGFTDCSAPQVFFNKFLHFLFFQFCEGKESSW